MQERDNVLRILNGTRQALEKGDSRALKNFSNQTINTASLTHDSDNIAVAVFVYSLSKIVERENYTRMQGWNKFYSLILKYLDKSILDIEQNRDDSFRRNFQTIRSSIENFSGELKSNIEDVFRKASINKASKIYEHGTSLEKTANLLGVTQYELANYAGSQNISPISKPKITDVKSRIKIAMDFFGK